VWPDILFSKNFRHFMDLQIDIVMWGLMWRYGHFACKISSNNP
jgi:hypothetical protein